MASGRRKRKVSLICADLAGNNVVRLYPIAEALARDFEIEIIGVLFGDSEVFAPYREALRASTVHTRPSDEMSLSEYRRLWCEVSDRATGDVLFAFKPLLASLGAALASRRRTGRPVVLDIEDWEAASFYELPLRQRFGRWRLRQVFRNQLDPINTRLMEFMIARADRRVVSSSFLMARYGGTRVVQGVNPETFNPDTLDPVAARESLGLPHSSFLVLFTGTAWPHKGLPDLIRALRALDRADAHLVVAGPINSTLEELRRDAGDLLRYLGERPHAEMPKLLAACDVVCLPQRDTPYARAQIPAKVFEAMAMSRPVIATDVSDLPEILDGCGIIVPHSDVTALEAALRLLARDSALRESLGRAARERCIRCYSWNAMADTLRTVFEPLVDR